MTLGPNGVLALSLAYRQKVFFLLLLISSGSEVKEMFKGDSADTCV
jgi:hypothetical protein